ncbi:MAG: hypothetical protein MUE85_04825 [Microscillaceae bacterium]|jgi:hypothetical protein|nr:hypothetical protein [Microscillaceae bacterium]
MRLFILIVGFWQLILPSYAQFNYTNLEVDYSQASNEKYTFQNLRLYPIRAKEGFRRETTNLGYYVSLQDAISANKVLITESSRGGTVNNLLIRNLSEDTLYIMAGEILQGGKQDRVVARDMLIPPQSGRLNLPVYCVERGRWEYKGDSNDNKFKAYYGVANEHLRDLIDHKKSQGDIWKEVSKTNQRDGVQSYTDAYTAHINNRSFRDREQEYANFFLNLFKDETDVIGVIAVTGNQVIGCDMFVANRLFLREYPSLIYSYIDEALTYGTPVNIRQPVVESYADNLLQNSRRQTEFIEEKGKAFRRGDKIIHIATY